MGVVDLKTIALPIEDSRENTTPVLLVIVLGDPAYVVKSMIDLFICPIITRFVVVRFDGLPMFLVLGV